MPKALLDIDANTNRVLNVVKSKYNLKDKSEAVEYVVAKYIDSQNDPELRPEYIEKLKRIQQEKTIAVDDFLEEYLS